MVCYICLDENKDEKMISPCNCSGKFKEFKLSLLHSAYSLIRTHLARFFYKHVWIAKNPDNYKKLTFHEI